MTRLPFYLVEISPWPISSAAGALLMTIGLTSWFHGYGLVCLKLGAVIITMSVIMWWRDVVREATFMGLHTSNTMLNLRYGMILFITSEVCFFFGFFWTFFHSSLSPVYEIGCEWPPMGLNIINPFGVPLLNTIVLLSSGVTVTWAHHSLKKGSKLEFMQSMVFTITLGSYFSFLQLGEYMNSSFSVADSVYGSIFFVATGFHGLHVLIGTIFLLVSIMRSYNSHYSSNHHFGFEGAAWYWHFVDVVWIFLFLCIYWWGS